MPESPQTTACDPPERRCCCPSWDRFECVEIRYSTSRGYDPEDSYNLTDDPCECSCHDEFRDWCDDDD